MLRVCLAETRVNGTFVAIGRERPLSWRWLNVCSWPGGAETDDFLEEAIAAHFLCAQSLRLTQAKSTWLAPVSDQTFVFTHNGQRAVTPPSTAMICPVIKAPA